MAAQGERLRGTMFATYFDGNTIVGKTGGGETYYAYLLVGGKATYEGADGTKDHGDWSIENKDHFCLKWRKRWNGKNRCGQAFLQDKTLHLYGDFQGEVKLVGYIVP